MSQKTPLYDRHRALGANIVDFHGWEMPIQYSGILQEHKAVREVAGVFDISHMGTVDLSGPGALGLVQELIANDASALTDGKALYTVMCLPTGGVVDDLLVYRLRADRYRLVLNAGNRDKDEDWIRSHAKGRDAQVRKESDGLALIAVQGPRARDIVERALGVDLAALRYYHIDAFPSHGERVMISRTGYTGELGYEIFVPAKKAGVFWDMLLRGGPEGVLPVGLGARDTLRMEMGYCLYGQELDEDINPLEAGLGWTVRLGKESFIGKEALCKARDQGPKRVLKGWIMQDKAIPRAGYPILFGGKEIGKTTSGGFSPSMGCGIALGYIPSEHAKVSDAQIVVRGTPHPARAQGTPLYRKPTTIKAGA